MPEWAWGLAKLAAAALLGAALAAIKLYLATHPLQPRHGLDGRRRDRPVRPKLRRVS